MMRIPAAGRHKSGAAQVLETAQVVETAHAIARTGPFEEQALATLYREHATAVRAFVRAQLPDPDRTEDVVQETFLRAWRQIARVDLACGNPRSYLFTTARNILTDGWRAQSRRPRVVDGERQLAMTPSEDHVEAVLEALTINEALGRLSAEHREVIQTLYYDGLSIGEAADRLGIAAGTVKSRSYYAVRALRATFDEMGILR